MLLLSWRNLVTIISIALIIVLTHNHPLLAKISSPQEPTLLLSDGSSAEFKARPRGRSGNREGGGRRNPEDTCLSNQELEKVGRPPLIALLPKAEQSIDGSSNSEDPLMAGTFESHPPFWFYIPYESPQGNRKPLQAIFRLQDENQQNYVTQPIQINLTQTPGIIKIQLPQRDNEPGLEVGKQYYWSLEIICTPQRPSRNIQVSGWSERDSLTPQIANWLKTATPKEQLEFYFSRSIWHESLALLAHLRARGNNTWDTYWNDLFKDEILRKVVDRPIVDCCSESKPITN